MKKWLLVLGMVTCILGISACGTEKAADSGESLITEEAAVAAGDQLVETISMICAQGQQEQYKEDAVVYAALSSWTGAMKDLGDYVQISDHTAVINEDGIIINVKVEGTKHNANVEVILDEELAISSITTSVIYSALELMEKAALNTLLGMGTVFVVLILISLLISLFVYIPKIQKAFTKKADEKVAEIPTPVDNTIAQIIEKEEMSDDLELAAVISAAIAASMASGGAVSTEGFVVRSIRKRRTV